MHFTASMERYDMGGRKERDSCEDAALVALTKLVGEIALSSVAGRGAFSLPT